MSKLKIYKASAGAGKTFALTMEYFKIVFSNPTEYKNVLAVTFTNKATEEMKSRIVSELDNLAEGNKSDYKEELMRFLSFSEEQIKDRAKLLRTSILHDYGRLAVTTIDRFFQRIIKSFTKELSIFPGYNVELDSEYVLLRAVDQVMQRMNDNKELRTWISELMNNSIEDAKSWSVKSKISELGREVLSEKYMLFSKEIQEKFNDKNFLKEYKSFLNSIINQFEDKLCEYGKMGCELVQKSGLSIEHFKKGKTGVINHFFKLKDKNLDSITVTCRKAINNPDEWVTKKQTPEIKSTIESILPSLNLWLQESIDIYDLHIANYNSAKFILNNLYQLGILNDIYGEIRTFCEEKGIMLLSDTTHILKILIGENHSPFIYEKVGNYYNHIMIDEFQDTSEMQYKNFKPLLENNLSNDNKGIIVGDVKQSIYRWRGGEWQLLAEGVESDFNSLGVNNIELEDNWRSSYEIVNFNNLFFSQAIKSLRQLFIDECSENSKYSDYFLEAYDNIFQNPQKGKDGYINIKFGNEKKEEGSDSLIAEEVIQTLLDVKRRGGELKECVVLVRDKKEGAFIAEKLIEHNNQNEKSESLPFISNDSLFLASSPYVSFLISVIKYIYEPYDKVNKATLLFNYLTFVRKEPLVEDDPFFKTINNEELFNQLIDIRFLDENNSTGSSLFDLTDKVIDKFNLKESPQEIPYLLAFQDMIFEYSSRNTNSIPIFLEWWEKEKSKRVLSGSENVDAIKILTMHKAKGLEYKYVILPFCSWKLDDIRQGRRIWCKNTKEDFNKLEYAPLNYSGKLVNSHFVEDYEEEHMKSYIDNLNLLYVALTRSKKELYIFPFAHEINKEGKPSTIGAFLFQVIELLQAEDKLPRWKEDDFLLEIGEIKEQNSVVNEVDNIIMMNHYSIFELSDRINVRYKYQEFTDPDSMENNPIDEGKLLHEIFQRIDTKNDVVKAINEIYREGLINTEEVEKYKQKVELYLSHPIAKSWFEEQFKVLSERDILLPKNNKARPDRILVKGKKAIVIDYKFGHKENKSYNKQVQYYCNLLKKMGFHETEGYIWYVNLEKVVSVN